MPPMRRARMRPGRAELMKIGSPVHEFWRRYGSQILMTDERGGFGDGAHSDPDPLTEI